MAVLPNRQDLRVFLFDGAASELGSVPIGSSDVVVDAATAGFGLTFNHTTAGFNRYLVVGVAYAGTSTSSSSVTYNSVGMTLLGRSVGPSSAAEVWGLINPTIGTNSVAITKSGTGGGAGGAISFNNANQTVQNGATGGAGSTGTTITSASITAIAGAMLVDMVSSFNVPVIATGTQGWNDSAGEAMGYLLARNTAQTISWTQTSADWADAIAAVLPLGTIITTISVSETALSFSDTDVATKTHAVSVAPSDTGLSFSDSLVHAVGRPESETALSFSDSSKPTVSRPKTDTVLTLSDTLTRVILRLESDTGLSFSDTAPEHATRTITDQALTPGTYTPGAYYNTGEGGTLGANPTTGNSGGASGTAFSSVSGPTLITYDNTHAHTGTQSYEFNMPPGTSSNYLTWALGSPTTSQVFFEGYFWFNALQSVGERLFQILDSGGAQCAGVTLVGGSVLHPRDASNTNVGTASGTIPTGQWIRLECRLIPSATAGEIEVRAWWTNPDGTGTPDYSTNATGAVLGADAQSVRLGAGSSNTHVSTDIFWLDDMGAWASNWIGPVILSFDSVSASKSAGGGATTNATPSETALSFSDIVVHYDGRIVSDTALTFSDTVASAKTLIKSETDTALSFSDSPGKTSIRTIRDGAIGGQTSSMVNNFETGTNTTAISSGNSSGQGNTAWTLISSSAPTYSNTQVAHGGLSMAFLEQATISASHYVEWDGLGANTGTTYGRAYFWFPRAADTTTNLIRFFDNAGTILGSVRMLSTGKIQVTDSTGTSIAGGSPTMLFNQWLRFEWSILPGAGTGAIQLRVWNSMDSVGVPDWDTTLLTSQQLGSNFDQVRFGIPTSPNAYTVDWTAYADDVAVNGNTWLGPAYLFSDTVASAKAFGRFATDTALTFSDSVVHYDARIITDTALTFSDAVATTRFLSKPVTDTALTFSDAVVHYVARPDTDTALSFSDTVATVRLFVRAKTDTALSLTDSAGRTVTHSCADTGLSFSDSVTSAKSFGRPATDTALSFSDSTFDHPTRVISETALSFSDTAVRNASLHFSETDTALTFSDTAGRTIGHSCVDTGLSFSDTVVATKKLIKSEADTALSFSDTVVHYDTRLVSDTALTFSDTAVGARSYNRSATDTALTLSDTCIHFVGRPKTDTALTLSDTVTHGDTRAITETALTFSDTAVAAKVLGRPVSDTGLSFSDTVRHFVQHPDTDTALSFSDAVAVTRFLTESETDTALAFSESVSAAKGSHFVIADTAVSFSDAAATIRFLSKTITDSALGFSDAVSHYVYINRPNSDTALNFSDTAVATKLLIKNESDTALTFSDSEFTHPVRLITDTGCNFSDTVNAKRFLSFTETDTALSFSDTVNVSGAAAKNVSDNAIGSFSDVAGRTVGHPCSESVLAFSDSLTTNAIFTRPQSDVALSFTDALRKLVDRVLTDSGLNFSDSENKEVEHDLTDVGLNFTDVCHPGTYRVLADTGATFSDFVSVDRVLPKTDSGTTTDASHNIRYRVETGHATDVSSLSAANHVATTDSAIGVDASIQFKSLVIGKAIISSHDVHDVNEDNVAAPKEIYNLKTGQIMVWVSGKGKSAIYL